MTAQDLVQNERIVELESRVRLVEAAVVELSVMTKFVKYGVMLVAASLGLDLTEMV